MGKTAAFLFSLDPFLSFHFQGRQLLIKAVNRVWTELIHSKKQVLEELFRVSLPVNDRGHVDIATARPLIEEAGLKCWQNHLGKKALGDPVASAPGSLCPAKALQCARMSLESNTLLSMSLSAPFILKVRP